MNEPAVRISMICATKGRSSLLQAISTVMRQTAFTIDDELLLVHNINVKMPKLHWDPRIKVFPQSIDPDSVFGNAERRFGITQATGTHLMFIDDDDAYLPNSIAYVKERLAINPDRPHMFKMIEAGGLAIWLEPNLRIGNQGGPQFVTPNNPPMLGEWGSRYEGDYDFMVSTMAKYPPNSLIWDSRVIYACREFGGIRP